jgi:hypothetical protein
MALFFSHKLDKSQKSPKGVAALYLPSELARGTRRQQAVSPPHYAYSLSPNLCRQLVKPKVLLGKSHLYN